MKQNITLEQLNELSEKGKLTSSIFHDMIEMCLNVAIVKKLKLRRIFGNESPIRNGIDLFSPGVKNALKD